MNLGKRLLSFAVAAGLLASLTGCGSQNSANSSSSASTSQPTGTGSASSSAPQAAPEGFTVAYTPVSAAGDTFIVQDPATDYYGLVDSTGKEILSCQYGDMAYLTVNKLDPKFYVAIQEKGSYGVYDLTGSQVVAPSYDSIRGADFSDGFVVCYHDRYGVVDLTGQEIIPLDYTGISCSAQGMVAGTKQADGGYTVDLYNKDGSLSQSWPAKGGNNTYSFYGYGTQLQGGGWYTLSGEERSLIGGMFTTNYILDTSADLVPPYFYYVTDSQLLVVDASTGETLVTQDLNTQLGTPVLLDFEVSRDLSTGTVHALVLISYYQNDKFTENQFFRFSLGDTVQSFDQASLSLAVNVLSGSAKYGMGPYYNGTAFAMTEDERLIVVDEAGSVVRELTVPFSDPAQCRLLGDCAVLNNNGYVYVIDKEGNTIANPDGYTGVLDKGILCLRTAEGMLECVDAGGNMLISAEDGLTDLDVLYSSDWEDGSFHSAILTGTNLLVDRDNSLLLAELDDTLTSALLDETATLLASADDTQLYAVTDNGGQWQVQLLVQR